MSQDTPEAVEPVSRRSALRLSSGRIALGNVTWAILIVFCIGATLSNPQFIQPSNLLNILLSAGFLGCLVVAQAFVLVTGHFDLSTESNMILSAIVGAVVMNASTTITNAGGETTFIGFGLAWPIGIAAMLLTSSLVGLVNGLLVVKLRMNPLMTTLAMMIGLLGIAILIGGSRQTLFPDEFRFLGSARLYGVPVAGLILLGLILVTHLVWTRLKFGRRLFAVGGNRSAARAAGINDSRTIILAYVICGLLAGLAAVLLTGRLGAASVGMSTNALFLSIAAAVIGGVSLTGGRGSAAGLLGGLLLIAMIANALTLSALDASWIRVATAAVILIAVFLDAVGSRSETTR